MFKSLTALLALFTMFVTSTNVHAGTAGQTYGGVQYAMVTYDFGGEDLEPSALVLRAGKYISDTVAIEGRFGFGIGDDSISGYIDPFWGTVSIDLEIDNFFGIYALGHLKLSEQSSIYGLLGFTQGETTFSGTSSTLGSLGSASEDESDMSFGFGFEHAFGRNNSFNIEYTQYIDKADFDASALSIGANFSF